MMMSGEPNVGVFIDDHKRRADTDLNAPPYDDLRNYAYEGGGSTAGSLSSRKKSPSSKKQLNAGCEQRKIWSFFCVIVNEEDDESIPKEFMDHTQVLGLEGNPFQRSAARLLNLFVSRFLAFSILSLSL